MKKRHYTIPEPRPEDFQLPYFLRDEEKYVELMASVADLLSTYPEQRLAQLARLNEAYQQITHGPHRFEAMFERSKDPMDAYYGIQTTQYCMWCQRPDTNH